MTKIDWCDETINPLGYWCYGPGGTQTNPKPCPYCYAKKLAARGMRDCPKCQRFEKHTHFEQLDKLLRWKKPKTIFVQSMGDLFHDEVPDEWIKQVFEACEKVPQHRYLFLTKRPQRYIYLHDIGLLPAGNNYWFGTTALLLDDPFFFSDKHNTFLSIEPLQQGFKKNKSDMEIKTDWTIVGAETGNRKGKVIPKREWIENIVNECRRQNVPVFMKNSLASVWGEPLIQEFPWKEAL